MLGVRKLPCNTEKHKDVRIDSGGAPFQPPQPPSVRCGLICTTDNGRLMVADCRQRLKWTL
jgi:hypothetical protein